MKATKLAWYLGDLDVTPTRFSRYSARLAGFEKEAFGSVMFSFGVLPPLWHETSEIINPAKRSRAAHLNRFRIRNDWRTNSGCKSTKTRCTKSDSVALFCFRRIFHPVWIRM
jgi:hypothetical protein